MLILPSNKVWDEPLNEAYAIQFIGGSGLAARYAYDFLECDTPPLSPENPLIFMTGPMVGTAMPSAGRYSVCARSPLTGIWGESNSGGFWGPELRFAGYDGIIITGNLKDRAGSPSLMVTPICMMRMIYGEWTAISPRAR